MELERKQIFGNLGAKSCGRDRGELVYLQIGGVSYKTMNYYWANIPKFPTKGISWGKTQTLTDFFM